jgi:hypothetical protein
VRRREELILELLVAADANSQEGDLPMPMYPFKTKAQGGLISEQETVSSETKASKTSTTSVPDAQEIVEDRSRWQNLLTGYIEIKVDRN